jgi:flagellar biosynthesis protein FlhG
MTIEMQSGPGTRVVSIASGKGGAGKTAVSVNLAFALASMGRRVCLLDADLGLSNVDVVLGVYPEKTLEDVLFEDLPIEEAVLNVGEGVDVISGSSGVPRMAELTRTARARLSREFAKLSDYDYLLVDNSPGITRQITSICLSSREILVVVNPEATSVTDAYALVKVLKDNGLWWSPLLLVNRTPSDALAAKVFERFKTTAQKHLKTNVRYLGAVGYDPAVSKAAFLKRSLVELAPNNRAAQQFMAAAMNLERCFELRKTHRVSPDSFVRQSAIRLKDPSSGLAAAPRIGPEIAALNPGGREEFAKVLTDLDRIADLVRGFLRTQDREARFEQVRRTHSDLIRLRRRLLAAAAAEEQAASASEPAEEAEEASAPHDPGPALAPAPHVSGAARKSATRPEVLLLCPDGPMRRTLCDLVRETGLTAVDALEGVKKAADDYRMALVCWDKPDERLERLVKRFNGAPLVLIRGFESGRLPGLEASASHVLDKPFKLNDLFGIINQYA